LWERRLDTVEAKSFPLTESTDPNAIQGMFWFPDGRYVGYFDQLGRKLRKIDLQSGTLQSVADVSGNQMAGSANADGEIVFSTAATKGIQLVAATGGASRPVTTLDGSRNEDAHLWPRFLPDGRRFIYLSTGARREEWAVYGGSLDSLERRLIVRSQFMAEFAAPNTLLYVRGDTLLAQSLDLDTLDLLGEPEVVQQPVGGTGAGRLGVSVSDADVLVAASGAAVSQGMTLRRGLAWVDRHGKEESLPVPPRAYTYARLSPDGTRAALDVRDQEQDIWVWDFVRTTLTRVTFGQAQDRGPLWTSDSRRLLIASDRGGGTFDIYAQAADGTGSAERLTTNRNIFTMSSVSPDGSEVIFEAIEEELDLFALPLADPHRVRNVLRAPAAQRNAIISPDGRWLAYQSSESGLDEIYVRPNPDVGSGRWQVSTGGGTRPLWARNGRELFYVAPPERLMSVRFEPGSVWMASPPTELFARPGGLALFGANGTTYDVSADGTRFLMIQSQGGTGLGPEDSASRLVVTQNWMQVLTAD
jgi:serine/threonine-protein kinase